MFFYQRILLFFFIWFIYIFFMSSYAPLGASWLEWNFWQNYNFSQFLKTKGYFSTFGFSIWSSCANCDTQLYEDYNSLYLTRNFFSLSPYIFINHFFGKEALYLFGPIVDKLVIFLSGVVLVEIFLALVDKDKRKQKYFFLVSTIIFTLFISNPWTYKMIIASWFVIYFMLFYLFGIYLMIKKKLEMSLIFFFISSLFDPQSALIIIFLYGLIIILINLKFKKIDWLQNFFFGIKNLKYILISLLIPLIIYLVLRIVASSYFEFTQGSSILLRVGISGDDIHNGGIIGALQFLGGNRLTKCFFNYGLANFQQLSLESGIYIYNCFLSTLSLIVISLIALVGLLLIVKNYKKLNIIVIPILFILIFYTFILQQSSSVHLMGYSYFFSVLFPFGIAGVILNLWKKFYYSTISIILTLPCIAGIILLCMRVSMLTSSSG